MRIELYIERLVLDGVASPHAPVVREAVTAELGRLLGAAPPGSWKRSLRVRRIEAEPITPATDPVQLSKGIAASVYGGIR